MSTGEDEPSPGLNGRLRPRKSNAPSPKTAKPIRKQENKPNQEKKRTSTPSKTTFNKSDDLSKTDVSAALQILCSFCDKTFGSKQAVANHTKRVHISNLKQDSTISCLLCKYVDTECSGLIRHMVDSHPNQYFVCLDCQTRFSSTAELAEHKQNVCDKQKLQYRNKLRQKTSAKKNFKSQKIEDIRNENSLIEEHGFNGIVISCELKPSHVHDDADIEDNITTNLILPSSKNLSNATVIEKNAVIVLDDLQWNKRLPPNFTFHNTDPDQILSRLGVVQRSSRTGESNRKDWSKIVDETNQKFEKCFDTSFYSKVASNVQENLTKFLDGSFNFNPDPDNTIKTRKLKNSVAINTAEGFPILLSFEQYTRNVFDGLLPRSIAPKHKWKWDNLEHDKHLLSPEQIKRDSHVNNCIITLVSGLDIWTQLSMRQKYEDKFNSSPLEKKTEKQNTICKELKEILEKKELPPSTAQDDDTVISQPVPFRDGLDFPASLGLMPTTPKYDAKPAVLSGEWVRPRCYVCCACGAQAKDSKALSSHISTQHPHAHIQYYEIVGELLLNSDILKHLYVPPSQTVNRTRPLRGYRECTKCKKSISLEDLHQHMLDCAGDTPTVRRKVRPRPFGVRKRRPRLPDNTIRTKMRKDIRSRHTRKNLMRPRPKIKTEVGDAETIRKMLADLPAKRHRVMINPTGSSLRPLKRNRLMIKRTPVDELKKKSVDKTSTPPNRGAENNKLKLPCRDDENNLKSKMRHALPKIKRFDNSLKRKPCTNKSRTRGMMTKTKTTIEKPEVFAIEDMTSNSVLLSPNNNERINVNDCTFNSRQQGNLSTTSSNSSSDNGSNNNGASNTENRSNNNNNRPNNNDNQQPGSSGQEGNARDFLAPSPNVPLKHSIASLTANSETHDKAVQFHHLFLVQQECNNVDQHLSPGQKTLFENEAVITKLDKPPLHYNYRGNLDPNSLQKNKGSKPRKGLNDCIAMLKNKLVDPPTHISHDQEKSHQNEKKSSSPKMTQEIAVQCSDFTNKHTDLMFEENLEPNHIHPITGHNYGNVSLETNDVNKTVVTKIDNVTEKIFESHKNDVGLPSVNNDKINREDKKVSEKKDSIKDKSNKKLRTVDSKSTTSQKANEVDFEKNETHGKDHQTLNENINEIIGIKYNNKTQVKSMCVSKEIEEDQNIDKELSNSKIVVTESANPLSENLSLQKESINSDKGFDDTNTESSNIINEAIPVYNTSVPNEPTSTLPDEKLDIPCSSDTEKQTLLLGEHSIQSSNYDHQSKNLLSEVNELQTLSPHSGNTISKEIVNTTQVINSNIDTTSKKCEPEINDSKEPLDMNKVPNIGSKMLTKKYKNANVKIPRAHCNAKSESLLTAPLDLSSAKVKPPPVRIILPTFSTYQTLDLSNKPPRNKSENIVDLSGKYVSHTPEPTSVSNVADVEVATNISLNRMPISKDSAQNSNRRSLSKESLDQDKPNTLNVTYTRNLCSPLKYIESASSAISQRKDIDNNFVSTFPEKECRNAFIYSNSINSDPSADSYALLERDVINSREIYDYTTNSYVRLFNPESFEQSSRDHIDNVQGYRNLKSACLNSDLTLKQICDPTHLTSQFNSHTMESYINNALDIADVHSTAKIALANLTHSISEPYSQYVSGTPRIPAQSDICYDRNKNTSDNMTPAMVTPLCMSETPLTSNIPTYNFINRGLVTSANKYETTASLYSFPNTCTSVSKIDSSNTTSVTNISISTTSNNITNTTSVYSLASTTIETPLSYLSETNSNSADNNKDPAQVSLSSTSLNINTNELPQISTEPNEKMEIHNDVSDVQNSKTINSLEQDAETARKIAMLPKELVEILGTMPIDHRNQLLNVLPQYVSTVSSSSSSTSSVCSNDKVSSSPRPSQKTTTHPEREKTPEGFQMSQSTTPPHQSVEHSNLSPSPVTSSFIQKQLLASPNLKIPFEDSKSTGIQHNQMRYSKVTECKDEQDHIIDLTLDDNPPSTSESDKNVETIANSVATIPTDTISDRVKLCTTKSNNDKTASLRAVRIKTQSERHKTTLLENHSQKPASGNMIPSDLLNTEDLEKALAIQQDEVSSTQKKNNLIMNPPFEKIENMSSVQQQDFEKSLIDNHSYTSNDHNTKIIDYNPSTDPVNLKLSLINNVKLPHTIECENVVSKSSSIVYAKSVIYKTNKANNNQLTEEQTFKELPLTLLDNLSVQKTFSIVDSPTDPNDQYKETKELNFATASSQTHVGDNAISEDSQDDVIVVETGSENNEIINNIAAVTSKCHTPSINKLPKIQSHLNINSSKNLEQVLNNSKIVTTKSSIGNHQMSQETIRKLQFETKSIEQDTNIDKLKSQNVESLSPTYIQNTAQILSKSKNNNQIDVKSNNLEQNVIIEKLECSSQISSIKQKKDAAEEDDSDDDISLAVIVKLKNLENLNNINLDKPKGDTQSKPVSSKKRDKKIKKNNAVTNISQDNENNIALTSVSSNSHDTVQDIQIGIASIDGSDSGVISIESKDKNRKKYKKGRRNNNVLIKNIGQQNQTSRQTTYFEHDINKENNISSESSNCKKNNEELSTNKLTGQESNKCSSSDPKTSQDSSIKKDKHKVDFVDELKIPEKSELVGDNIKETLSESDDIENNRCSDYNIMKKHSCKTLQNIIISTHTTNQHDNTIQKSKTDTTSTGLLFTPQSETVEKVQKNLITLEHHDDETKHNEQDNNIKEIVTSNKNQQPKVIILSNHLLDVNSFKINSNSVSKTTDEDENVAMPLRRSRRGKSLFVESSLAESNHTSSDNIEQKAPLTKKQLIFSKLLLDEEKHLKTCVSNNLCVTNISPIENSIAKIVEPPVTSDSEIDVGAPSLGAIKTNKRKKSQQTRKKIKKKKIFESKRNDLQDQLRAQSLDSTVVSESNSNTSSIHTISNADEAKTTIIGNSQDVEKSDVIPSDMDNEQLELDSTESDSVKAKSLNAATEKRKSSTSPSIDPLQSPQHKKCKLNIIDNDFIDEKSKGRNTQEVETAPEKNFKARSIACYNKPIPARRIRSKSVVLNSSKLDLYDPYDINLEDMNEDSESLNHSFSKKICGNKSQKTRLDDVLENNSACDKSTECVEVIASTSRAGCSTKFLDKNATNLSLKIDKKKVIEPCSTDSDDSSKSDVPLKKYAKEKEKKMLVAEDILDPKVNKNINDLDSHHPRERLRPRKKTKRTLTTEEKDDVSDHKETEEHLRSEQFMESFGFFSERKPRKSNLLATKKISETLNETNETDDVYFGLKERNPRKSNSKKHSETAKKASICIEKKIGKRNRKKKFTATVEITFCNICKKQFRRSDNYLRHQMSLLHISKLSEVELKIKTTPVVEEPNYLIPYKQQIERVKVLLDKIATRKNNSLPTTDIIIPTPEEILAEVKRTVREQQLSRRGLSSDEALFIDCCELLKGSHKNDSKKVEIINSPCNSLNCGLATAEELLLLQRSVSDDNYSNQNDGDVDSITAQNILESDEVRNLENDLISGLKEAACAKNNGESSSNYQPPILNQNLLGLAREATSSKNICATVTSCDTSAKISVVKPKKTIEVKDKMYPDIENIDIFEDKFDKIKRKCRSQAAAAKQTQAQAPVEHAASTKGRKKVTKKRVKKPPPKKPQNPVLTKGALKGFDGIKLAIAATVVSIFVPQSNTQSRKKPVPKKKISKKSSEVNRNESDRHIGSMQNKIDVYEFMDTDDAEMFDLRPSTLMERFKNICNKEIPTTSKATIHDEPELSNDSASDGDDFVYMSDDYVCSDEETENSLMSCELGNNKIAIDPKKTSPLKRKDATEKSAVMGKIFKHNAVRTEKKSAKIKVDKPSANMDQLFDSLLEDEPSSSMLNDSLPKIKEVEDQTTKEHQTSKNYESTYNSSRYSKEFIEYSQERRNVKDSFNRTRELSPILNEVSPIASTSSQKGKFKAPFRKYDEFEGNTYSSDYSSKYDDIESHDYTPASLKYDSARAQSFKNLEDYYNTPSTSYEVRSNYEDFPYHRPKSKERTNKTKPVLERKRDEGERPIIDFNTEPSDMATLSDDGGVARQRVPRKCTVGKQNVLAESWSSESEPDGLPPRPNSAESVIAGCNRKKKGRKKDGQISGGRRGNKIAKSDLDNRVNSRNVPTNDTSVWNSANRGNIGLEKLRRPGPSSAAHAVTPASVKIRPRPAPYYWSEGDEQQEHRQQHGWIVGDSHKKLVTMLAHAKGRKRNNDEKRHVVE